MDEKPIQRIRKILKAKNLSVSAFEKACGMSNNSIQAALKRNTNLKDETLNNILKTFPEISAEWLLTGEGSMIKSDHLGVSDKRTEFDAVDKNYLIQIQRDYIDKLKEEIRELKK